MKGHFSKNYRNKARETQERKEYSQRVPKGSHHISEGRKDDKQDSDSYGLYSITHTPESLPENVHSNTTWDSVNILNKQIRMHQDTGSSITIISSHIWHNLGKPMLKRRTKWIAAYDGHRMQHEGILATQITWKGRTFLENITVVNSDKDFGLI